MPALLVPIKAFGQAKARLAPVLGARQRSDLAKRLAAGVIEAAGPMEVFVVCDDEEVAAFAGSLGAEVLWTPGLGLSGAVGHGVAALSARGVTRVIVAHADLPRPDGLAEFGPTDHEPGVDLVPDRRRDGTNVLSLPSAAAFAFSYGPGSFERHRQEAERLGQPVRVLEDESLSIDVDVPSDLVFLRPAS